MRLIALVFVFAILGAGFAVSEEEVTSKLAKMENNNYGRTLLDTIQLQLSVEGPVEDLIRMLQNTQAELQKEQQADDDFIFKLQDVCDKDLATLVSEIEAAKSRIQQLEAELAEKIPIRDEKVRVRNEKIAFRQTINDKIKDIDAQKKLKDQEWAEEQQQHDKAQYVIEKAKQIIVEALKSASFLQKSGNSAFAQVSAHFNKYAKNDFKRKSWNQIFSLLSQITSAAPIQSDQSLVQKVIDLCDQLLGKIAESREIERRDYQHWVDEYNQTRNTLQNKVTELTAQINQLETEIDTLTKRINAAQAEKRDQEQRRDQKQTEHDSRLKWCNEENVNYSHRRQARFDEIEVVSDAIALLQSHLRLFRDYVNKRLTTVKKAK